MTSAPPTHPATAVGTAAGTSEPKPSRDRVPVLLCVFLFVLPALPTYVVLPGALKGNGSPARMMSLIMFGLVVLGFMTMRRTEPARRINPGAVILVIYFLLWLVIYGVGLLTSDDYIIATNKTRALVGLVAHVGVGLYIIARVRTGRQRDLLLACLATGLTFACLVGFLQSATSIDLRFILSPPGFVLNTENFLAFERMGLKRVTGTSQHPIEFSVLAAVTVPLTLYFARNANTKHMRLVAGLGCGVALLALPASISRSGIISLITALLVYMFAFKLRPIAIAFTATAAAIGSYVMAFPHIANALWSTIAGSAEDASVEARIEDYVRVSASFREHPIFGLGLGGSVPTVFGYLDNEWMGAIVQGGVIGLSAMILFSGGAIFGIAAALRGARTQREREQAYMLGAMATGILASSYTFDLFGFEQAATLFFIVFALLWSGFTVPFSNHDDRTNDDISGVPQKPQRQPA